MLHCLLLATILIPVAFWQTNGALLLFQALGSLTGQVRISASQHAFGRKTPDVSFSTQWQVLGPFRCGTREAVWGADPLEYWGGFSNLSYDEDVTFSSPLATGGIVKWSVLGANVTNTLPERSKAELVVSFPEVDWNFLQSIYGWPALQYQAWVRGHVQLNASSHQAVAIFADGILEFSIDRQRHFGGDFYRYRRAPLILDLAPGEHVIELRLIRDVRALGGLGEPTVNVLLETEIRRELLSVDERSLLVSETLNGKMGSAWASIDVQNNVAEWVEVLSISTLDFLLAMEKTLDLSPYQIRPLNFQFETGSVLKSEFPVDIHYRIVGEGTSRTQSFRVKLVERSLSQPQRLTYLHPAGIVSYAILRPPPPNCSCVSNQTNVSLPVIIGLHGAGLEADSLQVREMLDAAYGICAWILFPSGVTSWSGDDWHTWGVADIEAGLRAVSEWISAVGWPGPGISPDDWIVIGHSNGGQGVWFLTTHYPDNVIAAAPVSAYSSIENYVSYSLWQDSEPQISSILHRSRSGYKHELLLGNTAGVPILQQHGSNDANVPAYHSRLMHELLETAGWSSEYDELPGKGHWFDGVMTTPSLLEFYQTSLHLIPRKISLTFTISVPYSGDMASKGGIYVDQLRSPDRIGRLNVRKDVQRGVWYVKTQNIHRFHLSARLCRTETSITLVLDEMDSHLKVDPHQCESTWYTRDNDGKWMSSKQSSWQTPSQRYGRQLGAMDAILRTSGLFTIRMCSAGTERTALQISRNFLQYFAADSHLTSQCDPVTASGSWDPRTGPGNVITLSIGDELPNSSHPLYPVRVTGGRITLYKGCSQVDHGEGPDYDMNEHCHRYTYAHEPGMGALFLRPLRSERLELVVWGVDTDGLEQAARLVPTLTGAGQPELLILSHSCRWRGHAGLYAAGHFDKSWQISSGSFVSDGT